MTQKGTWYIVGLLLALDLVTYTFIPFTFIVLIPSLVLLPLWLVLVGRLLAWANEHLLGRALVGEKQPGVSRHSTEE